MASKKKAPFPGLPKDALRFLKDLRKNNDREWFEANRARYEASLREPARALIRTMEPHLRKISKHFEADDRKAGGSLMRIHRDVRFSKDKSPYKTNLGIQFRHERGKDVHAPGFYVHLDPDSCFLGIGMWHPERDALAAVRACIVESPKAWVKVRDDAGFRARFELGGESLKRPPRGFDPEHPCIEDLRRKDHIAVANLAPAALMSDDAIDTLVTYFQAARPYARFLTEAVGLRF